MLRVPSKKNCSLPEKKCSSRRRLQFRSIYSSNLDFIQHDADKIHCQRGTTTHNEIPTAISNNAYVNIIFKAIKPTDFFFLSFFLHMGYISIKSNITHTHTIFSHIWVRSITPLTSNCLSQIRCLL